MTQKSVTEMASMACKPNYAIKVAAGFKFYIRYVGTLFWLLAAQYVNRTVNNVTTRRVFMGIKPGPKRIAESTGKPDKRQRDNKQTPGNTPSLKPHKHKKGS